MKAHRTVAAGGFFEDVYLKLLQVAGMRSRIFFRLFCATISNAFFCEIKVDEGER